MLYVYKFYENHLKNIMLQYIDLRSIKMIKEYCATYINTFCEDDLTNSGLHINKFYEDDLKNIVLHLN